MIRFVFNFIFFGVLFYAIYIFFPDAFSTLTGWAGAIYDFVVSIMAALVKYISELTKPAQQNGNGVQLLSQMITFFW